MYGPAVDDQLPIDARGPHLVFEGLDFLGRNVRVVAAVQHQHLAADVLGIGRIGRGQSAVEAYHARHVGPAAGQFQHAGAAETVADRRHALGIAERLAAEHVEAGA